MSHEQANPFESVVAEAHAKIKTMFESEMAGMEPRRKEMFSLVLYVASSQFDVFSAQMNKLEVMSKLFSCNAEETHQLIVDLVRCNREFLEIMAPVAVSASELCKGMDKETRDKTLAEFMARQQEG